MKGDHPLASVRVGDVLTGTVTEVARAGAAVLLDGSVGDPIGVIGRLDHSWRSTPRPPGGLPEPGDRVSAEVIAVDHARGQVLLSRSATEDHQR